MPALQTVISELNRAFSKEHINELVARREEFAPTPSVADEKPLARGLVVKKGTPLHGAWLEFLNTMPKSLQEVQRAIIYHALGTKPPTLITFAWMPGYDWALTITHAPDTKATRGGITILTMSRYPGDKHPVSRS